ncbi:hypothetical protein P3W23_09150 [Luteibacter sp. PPL554]
MDAYDRMLEYWRQRASRTIGPVEAAVINAVLSLEQVLTPDRFDEETITGSLLGALTAGLPWVAPLVGTRSPEDSEIAWGGFSKSGPTMSEADYGADFALALRIDTSRVRIAIFQAKRPKDGRGRAIPVFEASTDVHVRHRQFLALLETGREIADGVLGTTRFSALDWIHYVGYVDNGPVHVPMSSLSKFARAARKSDVSVKPNLKVPIGASSLLELLARGATHSPDDPCSGWITMTVEQADKYLPHLAPLMPVFAADESGGGGGAALQLEYRTVVAKAAPDPSPNPNPSPGPRANPKPGLKRKKLKA